MTGAALTRSGSGAALKSIGGRGMPQVGRPQLTHSCQQPDSARDHLSGATRWPE